MHSRPLHPTSLRSILILPSHLLHILCHFKSYTEKLRSKVNPIKNGTLDLGAEHRISNLDIYLIMAYTPEKGCTGQQWFGTGYSDKILLWWTWNDMELV
jgi:hypothetical protein